MSDRLADKAQALLDVIEMLLNELPERISINFTEEELKALIWLREAAKYHVPARPVKLAEAAMSYVYFDLSNGIKLCRTDDMSLTLQSGRIYVGKDMTDEQILAALKNGITFGDCVVNAIEQDKLAGQGSGGKPTGFLGHSDR